LGDKLLAVFVGSRPLLQGERRRLLGRLCCPLRCCWGIGWGRAFGWLGAEAPARPLPLLALGIRCGLAHLAPTQQNSGDSLLVWADVFSGSGSLTFGCPDPHSTAFLFRRP